MQIFTSITTSPERAKELRERPDGLKVDGYWNVGYLLLDDDDILVVRIEGLTKTLDNKQFRWILTRRGMWPSQK